MKQALLSARGGDRATAYAMNNKIVPLPEGFLVTWIDSQRCNQWAIADPASGCISQTGALGGPCVDNHCGAALALAGEHVHAVTGGHHTPFEHCRMHRSQPGQWEHVATIDVKGTYPSVVADSQRRIHLAFRTPGEKWSLDYCGFADGRWTPARTLVMADKPGYIYWTNSLAIGADDALHLVLGNTRVLAGGALLYGASHIFSADGGETWRDDHGAVMSLPTPAAGVAMMVGGNCPDRVESVAHEQAHDRPGPRNLNYLQIILSNVVVDPDGVVHVVLHNGLTGTADLMSRTATGGWTAQPLTAAATNGDPASRVHVQSSLALLPDGRLRAALMVEQTDECVWGPPGTHIALVEIAKDGTPPTRVGATPSQPDCAHWLPAQPQCGPTPPQRVPPLLYTKGKNAGGFDQNKNVVETEVILCGFDVV